MRNVDIVIVGAGFAGAASAWALTRQAKQRGEKTPSIVIAEKASTLGAYSSGRNAGILRRITDEEHYTAMCVRSTALLQSSGDFDDVVNWCGGYLTTSEDARMTRWIALAEQHGVRYQEHKNESLPPWQRHLPASHVMHLPDDGMAEPKQLLQRYLDVAVDGGAQLRLACEFSQVEDIDSEQLTSVVRLGDEQVRCRLLINATGSWGQPTSIAMNAPLQLSPRKRHLFLYEHPAGLVSDAASLAQGWRWHVDIQREFYVRTHASGMWLSLCDAHLSSGSDDYGVNETMMTAGLQTAADMFPHWPKPSVRACLRTFSESGAPICELDATKNVLHVVGLGGHGATIAAAMGERAATLAYDRLR